MKLNLISLVPFILLIVVLNGCKVQKYDIHNSTSFILEDNSILINTDHNKDSVNVLMKLDLGANKDVIWGDIFSNKMIEKEKKASLVNETLKFKQAFFHHFENDLFRAENWKPLYYNRERSDIDCLESKYYGLIGNSFLYFYDKIIYIDFKDNKLKILSEIEKQELQKSKNFFEMKSRFDVLGLITIPILVNNITYYFNFDTGYNGSFATSSKSFYESGSESDSLFVPSEKVYIGNYFTTISGESGYDSTRVKHMMVKLEAEGENIVTDDNVIYTNSIQGNYLGMNVIKNYNWIIDYKNESIYIMNNGLKDQYQKKELFDEKFRKDNLGIKLAVASLDSRYLNFVGKYVEYVNGEKIDASCELLERLNRGDYKQLIFSEDK